MAKITIPDIASQFASQEALNARFTQVENELNDKVLYRDNPDGEPNAMAQELDMNTNRIINLPEPMSPNDAARLQDVTQAVLAPDSIIATQAEAVTLTAGQTTVVFATYETVGASFNLSGPNVDDARLVLGRDFLVASSTTIQLSQSYPAGATLQLLRNAIAGEDASVIQAQAAYDTVAQMKLDSNVAGTLIQTKGYYVAGDGGGASYLVAASQTVDGYGDHALAGGTVALLQVGSSISIKQCGAIGDSDGLQTGTENGPFIRAAIEYATAIGGGDVIFPPAAGRYHTFDGFVLDGTNVNLIGTGGSLQYGPSPTVSNHCIRVTGVSNTISNLNIYTDVALIRDDTGFAISLNGANRSVVSDCGFYNTASAAVWCTDSTDFFITNNIVLSTKADGIHVSNGCSSFSVDDNIVGGCEDDSIAVVGDVPAGVQPSIGSVGNNIIRDGIRGHGIAYINCNNIDITDNTISNTGYAGIGNYPWISFVYSTDVRVSNNTIKGSGTNPTLAENSCGIYIAASKDCIIEGNTIDGVTSASFAKVGILLQRYQNLKLANNTIRNLAGQGIAHIAGVTTAATDLKSLTISRNDFYNISQESIVLNPTLTTQDDLYISNNTFETCGYDGGTSYHVLIDYTLATDLRIQGNKALNETGKGYFYNETNCTNVILSDNTPEDYRTWVPVVASLSGAITSYSVDGAVYYRKGDVFFFSAQVTITDNGTGATGMTMTLPVTPNYWGGGSGRELNAGKQMVSVSAESANVKIFKYDGTYPAATGDVLKISGWCGT